MSQLALAYDDTLGALRAFGYTDREAAFLRLAALHSGYFLRRQFNRFLGKESGGTASVFIQKLVALRHAMASTYATPTCVYHLCSRPIYEALGEPDNRNRRDRQPLSIKNRLMGLDFVLTRPDSRFLATERAKLSYFNGLLKIDKDKLPAKVYRTGDATSSVRYFVDKYPIFLSERVADRTAPNVSFCFVDEGARTVSRFETYLTQYRALFGALPRFELIYVAAGPLLLHAAERAFQRLAAGAPDAATARSRVSLSDYFEARRLFEAGEFSSFDRAKLLRFRSQRDAFSGAETEALYERWRVTGTLDFESSCASQSSVRTPIPGSFSTCLLQENYDLFGTLTSF